VAPTLRPLLSGRHPACTSRISVLHLLLLAGRRLPSRCPAPVLVLLLLHMSISPAAPRWSMQLARGCRPRVSSAPMWAAASRALHPRHARRCVTPGCRSIGVIPGRKSRGRLQLLILIRCRTSTVCFTSGNEILLEVTLKIHGGQDLGDSVVNQIFSVIFQRSIMLDSLDYYWTRWILILSSVITAFTSKNA
jgi:hypothetical protein